MLEPALEDLVELEVSLEFDTFAVFFAECDAEKGVEKVAVLSNNAIRDFEFGSRKVDTSWRNADMVDRFLELVF